MARIPGQVGGARLGSGQKREDPAVLALRGGKSRRPALPESSPYGVPGEPVACPDWAPESDRAVWDQIAPFAIANNTLTADRAIAFLEVCEVIADYRKMRAQIYGDGFTGINVTVDGAGTEHQAVEAHPLITKMQAAARDVSAGLGRFQLNGTGRPVIVTKPKTDEWADFDTPLRVVGGSS